MPAVQCCDAGRSRQSMLRCRPFPSGHGSPNLLLTCCRVCRSSPRLQGWSGPTAPTVASDLYTHSSAFLAWYSTLTSLLCTWPMIPAYYPSICRRAAFAPSSAQTSKASRTALRIRHRCPEQRGSLPAENGRPCTLLTGTVPCAKPCDPVASTHTLCIPACGQHTHPVHSRLWPAHTPCPFPL